MSHSTPDKVPFELDDAQFPTLVRMAAQLRTHHRFSGTIVERGAALFGAAWAHDFERVVGSLCPTESAVAAAAKGYATFALQSMRLQAAFERDGVYASKTYEQAAAEVYFNEQHMMQEYLPGLLLSHFLWPHHYRQLQFFDSAFVHPMRISDATSFIE